MRVSPKEVNENQSENVPPINWLARLYLWACERLYYELAWFYDWVSWIVSAGHWRRWQAGIWQEVRGQQVLEIGCGTGAMVVQGVQRGLRMVGVDRSPAMLVVAFNRMNRTQCNGQLIRGDGRALPVQDGSFDTVMATFPSGYILDPMTLSEMQRVLRPGGRVVILGLWVELHLGKVGRLLPLFYGRPSEESLNIIVQRVATAGFQARWMEQRDGIFTVGVLVAERE